MCGARRFRGESGKRCAKFHLARLQVILRSRDASVRQRRFVRWLELAPRTTLLSLFPVIVCCAPVAISPAIGGASSANAHCSPWSGVEIKKQEAEFMLNTGHPDFMRHCKHIAVSQTKQHK